MAKSARSQVKKKFSAIRSKSRSSIEEARLKRVAEHLARGQKQQEKEKQEQAADSAAVDDSTMEVDPKGPKTTASGKISTSGGRGSARETFKGGKFLARKRAKNAMTMRRR
ncbi:hypothetical protein PYCC9005_001187 [Savitreella phatthalungensis]